ncbi:hypothetical protein GTY87_39470 [Streptomyces sp. SID7813]|nr:hypothetical protein [Streptomyces sp. SID7813]
MRDSGRCRRPAPRPRGVRRAPVRGGRGVFRPAAEVPLPAVAAGTALEAAS